MPEHGNTLGIDTENQLRCPTCVDPSGVHIDGVLVAARHEDEGPVHIGVNAVTGDVNYIPAIVPAGDAVGEGRRHRIALTGWCEICGDKFAIVYTQHKGSTFVEVVRLA